MKKYFLVLSLLVSTSLQAVEILDDEPFNFVDKFLFRLGPSSGKVTAGHETIENSDGTTDHSAFGSASLSSIGPKPLPDGSGDLTKGGIGFASAFAQSESIFIINSDDTTIKNADVSYERKIRLDLRGHHRFWHRFDQLPR